MSQSEAGFVHRFDQWQLRTIFKDVLKSILKIEDMNIKEVFVQVGDPDKEHKEKAWNSFPTY